MGLPILQDAPGLILLLLQSIKFACRTDSVLVNENQGRCSPTSLARKRHDPPVLLLRLRATERLFSPHSARMPRDRSPTPTTPAAVSDGTDQALDRQPRRFWRVRPHQPQPIPYL